MTGDFDHLTPPSDGEPVEYDDETGFRTPDAPIIPVAHGVDTARIAATLRVLDAAAELMGRRIYWFRIDAGDEALDNGSSLPRDSIRALRSYRLGLLGTLTTRTDRRPVHETLCAELGVTTEMRQFSRERTQERSGPRPDITLFRDGTAAPSRDDQPQQVVDTTAFEEQLRGALPFSEFPRAAPSSFQPKASTATTTGSLVETAIEYALDHDHHSLTITAQGDLHPALEGAFVEQARTFLAAHYADAIVDESTFDAEYEGEYPDDELVLRERDTTDVCRDLASGSAEHDVVVAPSLSGHYISAVAAETSGGIDTASQLWLGDGTVIATSPQLSNGVFGGASENPIGVIRSGCLLLEFLGWTDAATLVRGAIRRTLADGIRPRDQRLASDGSRQVPVAAFADAVVERLLHSGGEPGAGGVQSSAAERQQIRQCVAGLYNIIFEDQISPTDIELNQLFGADEEADIYLPEVGLNVYYWRHWSVERRLEVLLHELAHVEEAEGERDHGGEFYDRLVELTQIAAEWEAALERLFGEPITFDRVYRYVVESVHEETIEPDIDDVETRQASLRDAFGIEPDRTD